MTKPIGSSTPRTLYPPAEPLPSGESVSPAQHVDAVPPASAPGAPTVGSLLDTLESKDLKQAYLRQGLNPSDTLSAQGEKHLLEELHHGKLCLHVAESEANSFFAYPARAAS